MARRFKKSPRSTRKAVRKSRRTRRSYSKKTGRKNRVYTKRLGTRYPLGQRATIKLSWTDSGTISGNNTVPYVDSAIYGLNTLSSPAKNGTTDNRASKFLTGQFQNYRVKGMSYKITATRVDGATPQPSYMYFIPFNYADPPGASAGGDPGELEQINGARWKAIPSYNGGGAMTYLKGYADMTKLKGDREAVTDSSYAGGVSITGFWTDPTFLWQYKIGWAALNQAVTSSSNYMAYHLKTTYYVELFNVSMDGIE